LALGSGADKAASGLHGDAAAAAKRAVFFFVAGNGQLDQRLRFDFEVDLSAAPVDQRTGSNDAGTGVSTGSTLMVREGPSSDAKTRPNDGAPDSHVDEGFMAIHHQSYRLQAQVQAASGLTRIT